MRSQIAGVAWLSLLMSAVLAAGPAHATRVEKMSMRELLAESGAVFLGTVVSAETPCPSRESPCTEVTFDDVEVVAGGLPDGEPVFVLPEGLLENGSYLKVAGAPEFQPGSRYLVFVRAGDWFVTPVTNWFHSVFRQVRLTGERPGAFFVDAEGRAVTGVDETGFLLGESIAPPGPGGGGDLIPTEPARTQSPAEPTRASLLEALRSGDIAAFAAPEDELLQSLRALLDQYEIGDAAVRFAPAEPAVERRQAAGDGDETGRGLEPAVPDASIPRFREEGPAAGDPEPVPEPSLGRRPDPGRPTEAEESEADAD